MVLEYITAPLGKKDIQEVAINRENHKNQRIGINEKTTIFQRY